MIKPTLDEILKMEEKSRMESVEREISIAKFTNRMNLISGCLSVYSVLQTSIIIGAISGVKGND